MPYRCHRAPPVDINVYSDGSWIYPLKQFLGMLGAGVWWPNRDPAKKHRLSQAERELAYHRQYHDGAMLFTPIGGFGGSSTRTELAAAIVAILANGPVHIGSDSQAFIDQASDILHKLRIGKPCKYNWKTTSDGDLWEHFTKAAIAKGPKSIRLTKVKGHVTTQQVLDKVFRACDKKGNDKADEAADLAVEMHGEDVISIAKILHNRHRKYTSFMKDVAKHIVEAYLIHKELVARIDGQNRSTPPEIQYAPLTYYPCDQPATIKLQGNIHHYARFNKQYVHAANVVQFLKDLRAQPAKDQQEAITWIEMYIMYRLSGYAKPIADNPNKARSRATVSMQLNKFKSCIRGVISRLAADDIAKSMFCPIKVTGEKFLSLGISGRQAAPAIKFSIDDNMQKSIADKLITLGHQISGKKLSDFKGGSMLLRPKPLMLKGRVGWDSKLTPRVEPIRSCGVDRSEPQVHEDVCGATNRHPC